MLGPDNVSLTGSMDLMPFYGLCTQGADGSSSEVPFDREGFSPPRRHKKGDLLADSCAALAWASSYTFAFYWLGVASLATPQLVQAAVLSASSTCN